MKPLKHCYDSGFSNKDLTKRCKYEFKQLPHILSEKFEIFNSQQMVVNHTISSVIYRDERFHFPVITIWRYLGCKPLRLPTECSSFTQGMCGLARNRPV